MFILAPVYSVYVVVVLSYLCYVLWIKHSCTIFILDQVSNLFWIPRNHFWCFDSSLKQYRFRISGDLNLHITTLFYSCMNWQNIRILFWMSGILWFWFVRIMFLFLLYISIWLFLRVWHWPKNYVVYHDWLICCLIARFVQPQHGKGEFKATLRTTSFWRQWYELFFLCV